MIAKGKKAHKLVTYLRLQVGSKKFVQSCPEAVEGKAAAKFGSGAYPSYVSTGI